MFLIPSDAGGNNDYLDMIDPREACDEQRPCWFQRHRSWNYDFRRQHARQLLLRHDVYYLIQKVLNFTMDGSIMVSHNTKGYN